MVVPRRIMHRYCISHFRHHVLDILSVYLQTLPSNLDIDRYRAYVNDPARDYMSFLVSRGDTAQGQSRDDNECVNEYFHRLTD